MKISIIPIAACWISISLLTSCVTYLPVDSDFLPQQTSVSRGSDSGFSDPRFRSPFGVSEIDRIASMVSDASGLGASYSIATSEVSPLATIRGSLENCEIVINPEAAATIPPNSWAFIIGHEFAHLSHHIGHHGTTSPEEEFQADLVGAKYAMNAGFDLAAHIAWTLSRLADHWSPTHGSPHERVNRLGSHYGISREAVWMNLRRYGSM